MSFFHTFRPQESPDILSNPPPPPPVLCSYFLRAMKLPRPRLAALAVAWAEAAAAAPAPLPRRLPTLTAPVASSSATTTVTASSTPWTTSTVRGWNNPFRSRHGRVCPPSRTVSVEPRLLHTKFVVVDNLVWTRYYRPMYLPLLTSKQLTKPFLRGTSSLGAGTYTKLPTRTE